MEGINEKVTVGLGCRGDGSPGIVLTIPISGFVETPDGQSHPGIVVPASQAREIAYALLLNAEQLSSGSVEPPKRW